MSKYSMSCVDHMLVMCLSCAGYSTICQEQRSHFTRENSHSLRRSQTYHASSSKQPLSVINHHCMSNNYWRLKIVEKMF